jgi:hypothetical protein
MQTITQMKYEIRNGFIVITLEGLYSVDELLKLTRDALDNPEAKIPARILIDASRSKAVRSGAEIEKVANTVSSWKDEIKKVAFFVTSELHYGAIRMGTAFSKFSSFDIAPFRTFEDAENFLNEP